ncbi:MAG: DUF3857 and transglutaminase domain-containing protein [Flavobacteriaceae bacterium]|nr:DUF3857 and transglutaminase domain-containing protein [Flavobacteriaceae bacterium]
MMKCIKWCNNWFLGGLLLGVYSLSAQDLVSTYKQKFPDANFVILEDHSHWQIQQKNGAIQIKVKRYKDILYLDDTAVSFAQERVGHNSFFVLNDIKGATFLPKGDSYQEIKVSDYKEKNNLDEFFYDDSKTTSFVYPNLQKGAKSRLSYEATIRNPRFLRTQYFQSYAPIVSKKLSIEVKGDVKMDFKHFYTEGKDFVMDSLIRRNKKRYILEIRNQEAYDYEPNSPSFNYDVPHIVPLIASYVFEGKKIEVSASVDSLYDWYYRMVAQINQNEPDVEMQALVAQLIAGKTNKQQKIDAIYQWVQQQIKYIAYEYALGGFIPREANDIFRKKYGDCKDKSSILQEMLALAGIKSYLTWIGTRKLPYTYVEMPSPLADNHMILSVPDGDVLYFLDGTGKFLPSATPTVFIQGKDALIGMGKDNYRIEKVPIVAAAQNRILEKAIIQIEENALVGSSLFEMRGYPKVDAFYQLEGMQNKEELQVYYNKMLRKGNNSFLAKEIAETNKYDFEKPFVVKHRFRIAKYIKKSGDQLYVNLNLNKLVKSMVWKKDRKKAYIQDYKNQYLLEYDLQLPEGYTVSYLPENFEEHNDKIQANIRYELVGNIIKYRHELTLDFLEISKEELDAKRRSLKKISKAYREIIVLKKK